ncbi:MAG: hypothetical protein EOP21_04115, partial [Hyphomicrobiales bacterium]
MDRRVGLGLIALSVISTVIIVAIVSLFLTLNEQDRKVRDSVREDAIWAAYQLNNEAVQLELAINDALSTPGPETLKALTMRYDVLYSRASFLVQGEYAVKFDDDPDITDLGHRTYSAIMAMAPEFDRMVAAKQVAQDDIAALLLPAQALRG